MLRPRTGEAHAIDEAGGNPRHRNAPGPDSGEATESAVASYNESDDEEGAYLRTGSGDRNTARGSGTEDLDAPGGFA